MKKFLLFPFLLIAIGCADKTCSCDDDSGACSSTDSQNYSTDSQTSIGTEATDSDSVPDTVTQSEEDTSIATESITETDTTVVVNTDSESDTNTGDDSDSDTATGTDMDTDSETETAVATDSDSETESEMDTDTGESCAEMNWTCGTGINSKGNVLDCDMDVGCGDTGYWCSSHQCIQCNTDAHCGDNCAACGEDTFIAQPRCLEGASCVECLQDEDCPTDRPACDLNTHGCVQCTSDTHCRIGENPWVAAIAVCAPDHQCTCWSDSEDPAASCSADSCPDGFVCAQDVSGTTHFVCLKSCAAEMAHQNGIACTQRYTIGDPALVWGPFSSCYAFSRYGEDCESAAGNTPDPAKCRISAEYDDGQCVESENGFNCSYSCWNTDAHDDSVCPGWPEDTDACASPGDICKLP